MPASAAFECFALTLTQRTRPTQRPPRALQRKTPLRNAAVGRFPSRTGKRLSAVKTRSRENLTAEVFHTFVAGTIVAILSSEYTRARHACRWQSRRLRCPFHPHP